VSPLRSAAITLANWGLSSKAPLAVSEKIRSQPARSKASRGGDTSGRYPMAHPDTGGISLTSASGVPRARDIKIVLIPDFRT
jgi:hypothetical protein